MKQIYHDMAKRCGWKKTQNKHNVKKFVRFSTLVHGWFVSISMSFYISFRILFFSLFLLLVPVPDATTFISFKSSRFIVLISYCLCDSLFTLLPCLFFFFRRHRWKTFIFVAIRSHYSMDIWRKKIMKNIAAFILILRIQIFYVFWIGYFVHQR